ncbi:hypothetical protein GQ53DRAFT_801649 [Thozetella sp. PMI_491]|nr:hypothetical protein GQ53DRAFT_801649 [Thozetella sp. PMI_491]
MAYVVPIHRPTTVRHALLAKFLHPEEDNLIVARANRLEIWQLSDEGRLAMIHSKLIYGTISMLQKLRPKDSETDLLFVGTERCQFVTLTWNHELSQFETVQAFDDPGERYMRDSQSQDRCLVDPTGKFMAMHLWEGVLSVLRLPPRKPYNFHLNLLQQVRLQELFLKSSTFLYTESGQPTIAFLYRSSANSQDSRLAIYRLTENNQNADASRFDPKKDRVFEWDLPDRGEALLIPIRSVQEEVKRHNVRNKDTATPHLGGLLVVGETRLFYYDESNARTLESKIPDPSIFVAWAEYDESHYFVADDYGRMHLLTILTEDAEVTGFDMRRIGWTSRANNLVYLGHELLYVGSHYGDSQLFQIDLASETGNYLIPLQTIPNNGPILDLTVMDMGNREKDSRGNEYSSGQARVVTASGAHRDGSMRSMRSGVGLEDIGELGEIAGTRKIFSVKSHGSAKIDTLIISFLTETRVFKFEPEGDIEELESFVGMSFEHDTVLATNISGGRLLQVTSVCATLLDDESGAVLASWQPASGSIRLASTDGERLLVSVDGLELVSFNIANGIEVVAQKDLGRTDQLACLHVSPELEGIGVIGFFSGTVSLIDLTSLDPLHGESLRKTEDDASIPIDVALVRVMPSKSSTPTLFIALQDGTVTTFNVAADLSLSGKKSVVLGSRQARLHLLPQPEGLFNIFATSDHPSLIYSSEGRLVFSSVTADDATCVCSFDSEAFPDCIVLATESNIRVSRVDSEKQTHVRTLHMGETVRRIAYSPAERVFGVGSIKRELGRGEEILQSSFRLVHETSFEPVGKPFHFRTGSDLELVEAVIRAELPDSYGTPSERFLVGTSIVYDEDSAATVQGRILSFSIDSSGNPYLVFEHELRGGCRALAVMDGKVVAALSKTVVVSQYEETSTTTGHLTKLASYRPSTFPVDVAIHGDMIAVADLMKSTTLLRFSYVGEDDPKPCLTRVARHNKVAWVTAVSHVDGNLWLQADAKGNLTLLAYDPESVSESAILKVFAELNVGEMVNKIIKVEIDASQNAIIVPRAFLATVEGAVYLIGTIARDHDLLMRFQERLGEYVKTTGNLNFFEYRACRDVGYEGNGPERFLDGELLEHFLDLGEEAQKEVCEGLGPSVEDMRNKVEELKRLH